MVSRLTVSILICFTILVAAPTGANTISEDGFILVESERYSIDCDFPGNDVEMQSRDVGIASVCFAKPPGITGYHVEYEPTVPCSSLGTFDLGSQVLVYGTLVVAQPFELFWDYTTSTYTPPPCLLGGDD